MPIKKMPVGSIVRGIKGQYSGKVYVVVKASNVFTEQGYPKMPDDFQPTLGPNDRKLEWAKQARKEAMNEGRFFLYTLKNKDSTIKVWDYLLNGGEGQQPSFHRVAGKYGIDELTRNNDIARRNKERDDRMKRYKFNTNIPTYDKDGWSYDKWSAGSNA